MKVKTTLALAAALAAATTAWSATDYSATIRDLTPYITNQLQATGAASLALVLVDSNQVVWVAGFGLADPVAGVAADADTIYCLASVSKTFTAFAALRLVDRGLLDIDAPVTNYVPAFGFLPLCPGAATITPRLLLNHQSGLPGDFVPHAETTIPYANYGADLLTYIAGQYPATPPNFMDAYNNNGFTLMESVIAALSATSFTAQVNADIFQRLNMTNTAFLTVTNMFGAKLARSLTGTNVYVDDIVNVHASGGIYSSANDLAEALKMLLGGGVYRGQPFLSPASVAAMLTFQGTNLAIFTSDGDTRNGLGWDNVADPKLAYAGRACFKGGDTVCFHSHFEIMPERGLGVAVLANGGSPSMSVAQQALMLALRDKFGIPLPTNSAPFPDSPVVTNPPLPWEQMAGYYAWQGGAARVVATNGMLNATLYPFNSPVPWITNLITHSNGWFWAAGNTNAQIGFSNVSDHLFLMAKGNRGSYWNTTMLGERIAPAPLSAAWTNRSQTTWLAADPDPFSFNWAQNSVKPQSLSTSNGFALFLEVPFAPTNDSLAFPYLTSRNDSGTLTAIATNGEDWLCFMGGLYRPLAGLPVLAAPGATNSALAGNVLGWYRVPRSGRGRLELKLTGTPLPQARVLDAAFNLLAPLQPAAGRILAAATGDVYVAVSRSLAGGNAYALRALWRRVAGDYDGDGKADPALYGPAQALYGVAYSASGYAHHATLTIGQPNQTTAAEDYDGDGKMDPAVYDAANGAWQIAMSAGGYAVSELAGFGAADAIPAVADYDGDGKADPALYRAADGAWGFKLSADGYATTLAVGFGGAGWTAVPADYDGDGKTDPAIYLPAVPSSQPMQAGHAANGIWAIGLSGSSYVISTLAGFGASDAIPAVADYDGDGKADPALYRAADGTWGFKLSASNYATTLVSGFGGTDFAPVPADYDGDGKADPACYRQGDGLWGCILSASSYTIQTLSFGGIPYQPAR